MYKNLNQQSKNNEKSCIKYIQIKKKIKNKKNVFFLKKNDKKINKYLKKKVNFLILKP